MEEEIKKAIEEYQCSGCINGHDVSCFMENPNGGVGCGGHKSGTFLSDIGNIFLGMPKGFNRLGENKKLQPYIFKTFEDSDWSYDKYNVPVWKYLKDGHTFVRGVMPRKNETFIHIYLEDCVDKINCIEITESDIDYMD